MSTLTLTESKTGDTFIVKVSSPSENWALPEYAYLELTNETISLINKLRETLNGCNEALKITAFDDTCNFIDADNCHWPDEKIESFLQYESKDIEYKRIKNLPKDSFFSSRVDTKEIQIFKKGFSYFAFDRYSGDMIETSRIPYSELIP